MPEIYFDTRDIDICDFEFHMVVTSVQGLESMIHTIQTP
jgi:hypothetical protein